MGLIMKHQGASVTIELSTSEAQKQMISNSDNNKSSILTSSFLLPEHHKPCPGKNSV